jgi:2-succinyl-6-hydroxy-2,4-cyclohexadiene-1-carboxylate synthase
VSSFCYSDISFGANVQTSLLENMILRTTGSGNPILWIHGLGESSLCFEQLTALSPMSEYQHWLLDLPGYGRSPWVQPMDLSQVTRVLEPLLYRLGRPVVVGHSMGGVLASMLAKRFGPDLVRAVVNIEGNVSLGDCQYSGRVASDSLEDFLATGRDCLLDDLYRRGVEDRAHRGYFVSMRLAQPDMVYLHSQDLVKRSKEESLVGQMSQLRLPLLYIAGFPNGVCQRSLELLEESGLTFLRIEGSGHWPFLDQPTECAKAIDDWLHALEVWPETP